jgi:hypothetical protein
MIYFVVGFTVSLANGDFYTISYKESRSVPKDPPVCSPCVQFAHYYFFKAAISSCASTVSTSTS